MLKPIFGAARSRFSFPKACWAGGCAGPFSYPINRTKDEKTTSAKLMFKKRKGLLSRAIQQGSPYIFINA